MNDFGKKTYGKMVDEVMCSDVCPCYDTANGSISAKWSEAAYIDVTEYKRVFTTPTAGQIPMVFYKDGTSFTTVDEAGGAVTVSALSGTNTYTKYSDCYTKLKK